MKILLLILISLAPWTITSITAQKLLVVPADGDLQAAADAAKCGDSLEVAEAFRAITPGLEQPALVWKGKCSFANPVTIAHAKAANLPATLKNLAPAQLRTLKLPLLITDQATPALEVRAGASGLRLIGFEIRNDSKGGKVFNNVGLVVVGMDHGGSNPRTTLETVPADFECDRCWVHSEEDGTDAAVGTSAIGFSLGAKNVRVINSRVAGFRAFYPADARECSPNCVIASYAILINKGPGPYEVRNSFLESWFATIFTGGGPQWITNRATVIAAEHLSAPLTYRITLSQTQKLEIDSYIAFKVTGQPSPFQVARVTALEGNVIDVVGQPGLEGGTTGNPLLTLPDRPGEAVWDGDRPRVLQIRYNTFYKHPAVAAAAGSKGYYGKGHIEFKTAQDAVVEANEFGGFGAGFTITSRNQPEWHRAGSDPWATIINLLFKNNRWKSVSPTGAGAITGVQLSDNMATTMPGAQVRFENCLFDKLGTPLLAIGGSAQVSFSHVTALGGTPAGEVPLVFSYGAPNLGLRIEDSVLQNNEYGITCTLGPQVENCNPGFVFRNNVVLDNRSPALKEFAGPLSGRYPAGNFFPATMTEIGFSNWQAGDWRLGGASPYKGRASDATDPGVNMDVLLRALGGGPPAPAPSPTPTPAPPNLWKCLASPGSINCERIP